MLTRSESRRRRRGGRARLRRPVDNSRRERACGGQLALDAAHPKTRIEPKTPATNGTTPRSTKAGRRHRPRGAAARTSMLRARFSISACCRSRSSVESWCTDRLTGAPEPWARATRVPSGAELRVPGEGAPTPAPGRRRARAGGAAPSSSSATGPPTARRDRFERALGGRARVEAGAEQVDAEWAGPRAAAPDAVRRPGPRPCPGRPRPRPRTGGAGRRRRSVPTQQRPSACTAAPAEDGTSRRSGAPVAASAARCRRGARSRGRAGSSRSTAAAGRPRPRPGVSAHRSTRRRRSARSRTARRRPNPRPAARHDHAGGCAEQEPERVATDTRADQQRRDGQGGHSRAVARAAASSVGHQPAECVSCSGSRRRCVRPRRPARRPCGGPPARSRRAAGGGRPRAAARAARSAVGTSAPMRPAAATGASCGQCDRRACERRPGGWPAASSARAARRPRAPAGAPRPPTGGRTPAHQDRPTPRRGQQPDAARPRRARRPGAHDATRRGPRAPPAAHPDSSAAPRASRPHGAAAGAQRRGQRRQAPQRRHGSPVDRAEALGAGPGTSAPVVVERRPR